MSNISPLINVMKTAYNKVNRRIYRDFGEIENLQGLDEKIDRFFNKTYEFIEYNLKDYLTYCRPEWEFLDNKNSTVKKNTYYWLLEPLSGKENFKRSIPIFSSSISVLFNDKVIASSVYDPLRNDFYFTEEGKGAFLNDRRIRVAKRNKLSDSVVVTGIPHIGRGNKEQFIEEIDQIISEVAGIRRSGSAALDLAWVAAGRYDAYWEYGLSLWDIAAGIIIIREAGGVVTGLDGSEDDLYTGNVIAGNDNIHESLLKKIKNIYLQDD